MINDFDLDPFGDGSLLESYRFEDSLVNEQGTNQFNSGSQASAKYGKGILRPIQTDALVTTNPVPYVDGDSLSISAWIKFERGEVDPQYGGYLGWGEFQDENSLGMFTYNNTDPEDQVSIVLTLSTSYQISLVLDDNVDFGEMNHVILNFNGITKVLTLFVNQIEITNIQSDSYQMTPLGFKIGAYRTNYEETLVDQVMLFNRELTAQEIYSLYVMNIVEQPFVTIEAKTLKISTCITTNAYINSPNNPLSNYDGSLDPLNNGKLVDAWLFEDDFISLHGVNLDGDGIQYPTFEDSKLGRGWISDYRNRLRLTPIPINNDPDDMQACAMSFFTYIDKQTTSLYIELGKLEFYIASDLLQEDVFTMLLYDGSSYVHVDNIENIFSTGWHFVTVNVLPCGMKASVYVDGQFYLFKEGDFYIYEAGNLSLETSSGSGGVSIQIDQLSLWNSTLTVEEQLTLMQMGAGVPRIPITIDSPVQPLQVELNPTVIDTIENGVTLNVSPLNTHISLLDAEVPDNTIFVDPLNINIHQNNVEIEILPNATGYASVFDLSITIHSPIFDDVVIEADSLQLELLQKTTTIKAETPVQPTTEGIQIVMGSPNIIIEVTVVDNFSIAQTLYYGDWLYVGVVGTFDIIHGIPLPQEYNFVITQGLSELTRTVFTIVQNMEDLVTTPFIISQGMDVFDTEVFLIVAKVDPDYWNITTKISFIVVHTTYALTRRVFQIIGSVWVGYAEVDRRYNLLITQWFQDSTGDREVVDNFDIKTGIFTEYIPIWFSDGFLVESGIRERYVFGLYLTQRIDAEFHTVRARRFFLLKHWVHNDAKTVRVLSGDKDEIFTSNPSVIVYNNLPFNRAINDAEIDSPRYGDISHGWQTAKSDHPRPRKENSPKTVDKYVYNSSTANYPIIGSGLRFNVPKGRCRENFTMSIHIDTFMRDKYSPEGRETLYFLFSNGDSIEFTNNKFVEIRDISGLRSIPALGFHEPIEQWARRDVTGLPSCLVSNYYYDYESVIQTLQVDQEHRTVKYVLGNIVQDFDFETLGYLTDCGVRIGIDSEGKTCRVGLKQLFLSEGLLPISEITDLVENTRPSQRTHFIIETTIQHVRLNSKIYQLSTFGIVQTCDESIVKTFLMDDDFFKGLPADKLISYYPINASMRDRILGGEIDPTRNIRFINDRWWRVKGEHSRYHIKYEFARLKEWSFCFMRKFSTWGSGFGYQSEGIYWLQNGDENWIEDGFIPWTKKKIVSHVRMVETVATVPLQCAQVWVDGKTGRNFGIQQGAEGLFVVQYKNGILKEWFQGSEWLTKDVGDCDYRDLWVEIDGRSSVSGHYSSFLFFQSAIIDDGHYKNVEEWYRNQVHSFSFRITHRTVIGHTLDTFKIVQSIERNYKRVKPRQPEDSDIFLDGSCKHHWTLLGSADTDDHVGTSPMIWKSREFAEDVPWVFGKGIKWSSLWTAENLVNYRDTTRGWWTLSFWVQPALSRFNGNGNSKEGTGTAVFRSGGATLSIGHRYLNRFDDWKSKKLVVQYFDTTTVSKYGFTPRQREEPHRTDSWLEFQEEPKHIVMQIQNLTQGRCYVNGEFSSSFAYGMMRSESQRTDIGTAMQYPPRGFNYNIPTVGRSFMLGVVGNIRVFNRKITDSEISRLFEEGKGFPVTHLVEKYHREKMHIVQGTELDFHTIRTGRELDILNKGKNIQFLPLNRGDFSTYGIPQGKRISSLERYIYSGTDDIAGDFDRNDGKWYTPERYHGWEDFPKGFLRRTDKDRCHALGWRDYGAGMNSGLSPRTDTFTLAWNFRRRKTAVVGGVQDFGLNIAFSDASGWNNDKAHYLFTTNDIIDVFPDGTEDYAKWHIDKQPDFFSSNMYDYGYDNEMNWRRQGLKNAKWYSISMSQTPVMIKDGSYMFECVLRLDDEKHTCLSRKGLFPYVRAEEGTIWGAQTPHGIFMGWGGRIDGVRLFDYLITDAEFEHLIPEKSLHTFEITQGVRKLNFAVSLCLIVQGVVPVFKKINRVDVLDPFGDGSGIFLDQMETDPPPVVNDMKYLSGYKDDYFTGPVYRDGGKYGKYITPHHASFTQYKNVIIYGHDYTFKWDSKFLENHPYRSTMLSLSNQLGTKTFFNLEFVGGWYQLHGKLGWFGETIKIPERAFHEYVVMAVTIKYLGEAFDPSSFGSISAVYEAVLHIDGKEYQKKEFFFTEADFKYKTEYATTPEAFRIGVGSSADQRDQFRIFCKALTGSQLSSLYDERVFGYRHFFIQGLMDFTVYRFNITSNTDELIYDRMFITQRLFMGYEMYRFNISQNYNVSKDTRFIIRSPR